MVLGRRLRQRGQTCRCVCPAVPSAKYFTPPSRPRSAPRPRSGRDRSWHLRMRSVLTRPGKFVPTEMRENLMEEIDAVRHERLEDASEDRCGEARPGPQEYIERTPHQFLRVPGHEGERSEPPTKVSRPLSDRTDWQRFRNWYLQWRRAAVRRVEFFILHRWINHHRDLYSPHAPHLVHSHGQIHSLLLRIEKSLPLPGRWPCLCSFVRVPILPLPQ